jgi:hypothetical protein
MPVATTVMASATTLAALAAAVGTILALCTSRRTRQAPADPAEPPSLCSACLACLAPLLLEIVYVGLSESLAAANAQGSEMFEVLAQLKEILEDGNRAPTISPPAAERAVPPTGLLSRTGPHESCDPPVPEHHRHQHRPAPLTLQTARRGPGSVPMPDGRIGRAPRGRG